MFFHVRRCAGSRARVWPSASEKKKGVKLTIDTIERLGLAETRGGFPVDDGQVSSPVCTRPAGVWVNASDDRAERGGQRLGESHRRGTAAGNSQRSGRRRRPPAAERNRPAVAARSCTFAAERTEAPPPRCRRSSAARTQTRRPKPPVQSQSISST